MRDVSSAGPRAKCLVLLATYNGERFLDDQIRSIEAQDLSTIDILASDDGSADGTLQILEGWRERWPKGVFEIAQGPKEGFAGNFRSLALRAPFDVDYVAFSDQDDVWDADKISTAISRLLEQPAASASLYFSRTRLVDENGRTIGTSPLFLRPPSFRNAIVQSIGGGNTVMLNRGGFELFRESARRTGFVTHDWWSYLVCSGAGGTVYYDAKPHISYRQHGANLVGQNTSVSARIDRLVQLLAGRLSRWTDTNLEALQARWDLLSPEAQEAIEALRRVVSIR